MIRHHPDDSLLVAFATGNVARGPSAVISAHAEGCLQCAARLRQLAIVGGALLEQLEPAALGPGALENVLARIDAIESETPASAAGTSAPLARLRAKLPAGVAWPRSLWHSTASGWRRVSPNVRWCRVRLASDPTANLYLLRVAAGKPLPVHTHRGGELTHVLHGAFYDEREHFCVGDFEAADDRVLHQPVTTEEGECICLTSVEGQISFDGQVARMMGSLLGL